MDSEKLNEIISAITAMGYFKFTPKEDLAKAIENAKSAFLNGLITNDFDLWDERHILASRDRRAYGADNEDLAEGDVAEIINSMKDILKAEGVNIDNIENNFGVGEAYDVVINGESFPIYSKDELETKEIWSLSLRRLLNVVNTLLDRAGSKEHLYGINGGNDGVVVLLTRELREYFVKNLGIPEFYIPYDEDSWPEKLMGPIE